MAQSAAQKLRDTETEIAVLQVQYSNLNSKVEDLKTGLKELHSSLDIHMTEIRGSINSSKEEFSKSLNTFKDEINNNSAIEHDDGSLSQPIEEIQIPKNSNNLSKLLLLILMC